MNWFSECFGARKAIIGMLHLPPLAGAPRHQAGDPPPAERVLADAQALVEGGVHGLMLENFGDAPFFPRRVPASVVAQMTALAVEVRRRFPLPLGINVLRNDGRSALAIAQAAGAQFIRVNVLCGVRVTDQGLIEGIAHQLLRDRRHLGGCAVRILADVDVKHSAPLAPQPIDEQVRDLLERGAADGLIATGAATGRPTDLDTLRRIRTVAGEAPLLVGSGVTPDTLSTYLPLADGFIVGTWLKREGRIDQPIDPDRVRQLADQLR